VQIQSQCIRHDHRRAECHPANANAAFAGDPEEPGYFTGHTFRESGVGGSSVGVFRLLLAAMAPDAMKQTEQI
jgi:hypothetical protein